MKTPKKEHNCHRCLVCPLVYLGHGLATPAREQNQQSQSFRRRRWLSNMVCHPLDPDVRHGLFKKPRIDVKDNVPSNPFETNVLLKGGQKRKDRLTRVRDQSARVNVADAKLGRRTQTEVLVVEGTKQDAVVVHKQRVLKGVTPRHRVSREERDRLKLV